MSLRPDHGTFVLPEKAAADNVDDTTMALDLHTDETCRLSTIGMTAFQVLLPASTDDVQYRALRTLLSPGVTLAYGPQKDCCMREAEDKATPFRFARRMTG